MNPLAEATTHRPFSNGTEGEAWMSAWCAYCVHDHNIHPGGQNDGGCELVLFSMMPDFPCVDFPWPEAWLPEPTGSFSLPSRLICGQFKPCHEGDCTGDPAPEERAERGADVAAFWKLAAVPEEGEHG